MTSQLLFIGMSFDATGEKLQPVEHDSCVTVVKARIMPIDLVPSCVYILISWKMSRREHPGFLDKVINSAVFSMGDIGRCVIKSTFFKNICLLYLLCHHRLLWKVLQQPTMECKANFFHPGLTGFSNGSVILSEYFSKSLEGDISQSLCLYSKLFIYQ